MRIPNLKMAVVQTDGNDVEPVMVDEIRISVAETYDVIVQPTAPAYTIFAQVEDRTGYARGTLAQREGMTAPVPPMDPRPLRTMVDMGMGMAMGASGHEDGGRRVPEWHRCLVCPGCGMGRRAPWSRCGARPHAPPADDTATPRSSIAVRKSTTWRRIRRNGCRPRGSDWITTAGGC